MAKLRNDLLQGAGKLSIVNVNGNSEPERMTAFVDAIAGKKASGKDEKDKRGKPSPKLDDAAAAQEIAAQIAKLSRKTEAAVATPAKHAAEHGDHAEH